MSSSNYTPWVVTVGEQPTTAYWNLLGMNDASFNSGQGFNDNIIIWRHLSSDIVPTGIIQSYAGMSSPSSQWLLCDGSAYSRTTYAALFAVCGINYGAGDGSSTFNVPNLAGRVPAGQNINDSNFSTIGQMGGEDSHRLTKPELPSYGYDINDPGHAHFNGQTTVFKTASSTIHLGGSLDAVTYANFNTAPSGTGIWLTNNGGDQAHNNLQPYTTVNYLIKT